MKYAVNYNVIYFILLILTTASPSKIYSQQQKGFSYPVIPENLIAKADRAEYAAINFWNDFNYEDLGPEETEQIFVDFITILDNTDKRTTQDALYAMIVNILDNEEVVDFIIDCSQKYLYDKGAPTKDHQKLSILFNLLLNNNVINSDQREIVIKMSENAKRNEKGSVSPDFKFITSKGFASSFYNNISELNLLFFFDPLCQSCLVMGEEIANSPIINEFAKDHNLNVLYITPYTDQVDSLNTYFKDIPDNWILGYNNNEIIIKEKLYFWEYIPSIYLIDNNKKIILKDALPEIGRAHV